MKCLSKSSKGLFGRVSVNRSVGNVIDETHDCITVRVRDHRYIGQPVNIEKWGNFASEIGARVHGTRGRGGGGGGRGDAGGFPRLK